MTNKSVEELKAELEELMTVGKALCAYGIITEGVGARLESESYDNDGPVAAFLAVHKPYVDAVEALVSSFIERVAALRNEACAGLEEVQTLEELFKGGFDADQ